MIKKIITTTVIAFMAIITAASTASAANNKQPLRGMITSVAHAKNLASSQYSDGTNVVVSNWGHYPVDVTIVETGEVVTLNAKTSYFVYSPYYYANVWIDVSDSVTGDLIFSGVVDNPGTLDIDSPMMFAAGKDVKAHKFVVHKKAGL